MCSNENGIGGGFFGLMVLCFFCFVKQTELVLPQNIILLFTGLTKAGSLGIGENLVHMIQLLLQFFNLRLLGLNLALLGLDRAFQSSHFSSRICSFLICCGHERSS